MATILADNAYGTLASGLATGDTTLTFTTGHGARFPTITGSDVCYVCILNSANVLEEVIITAHAAGADTATITRAAGGTTAKTWTAGDRVEARLSKTAISTYLSSYTNAIMVAISDETSVITTGTAKVSFRMPFAFTLTSVRASLTTASSSGTPTFDINESGSTILSTKLTIDASELTSTTAAVAAVISDTSLADDALITIDIDVAGTGAVGAKIYLLGYPT